MPSSSNSWAEKELVISQQFLIVCWLYDNIMPVENVSLLHRPTRFSKTVSSAGRDKVTVCGCIRVCKTGPCIFDII